MKPLFIFSWFFLLSLLLSTPLPAEEKVHFVTATDTEHYTWTLNLIASIHRYHPENVGEIAVFDLGLTAKERKNLYSLSYVAIYDIEQTNPLILQKFTVNKNGKIARGLYSWKPVVLKQALGLFPSFFYLDSGITLLGPMDLLFRHLEENDYFFIDCGHSIRRMTTKPLLQKFQLNHPDNEWILDEAGISAGIQGITRALYSTYVYPLYEMSFDITYFEDDGSCPKGFGWARHDQTLFSIQARLLKFTVQEGIRSKKINLRVGRQNRKVSLGDFFTISREDFDLSESQSYLKYKN